MWINSSKSATCRLERFVRVKREECAQVKGYILSEGRDADVTMILSMKNWQTAWTRREDLSWMQLKK